MRSGHLIESPREALHLHLAQWEWSDTPGRLEDRYWLLLQTTGRYASGYGGSTSLYAEHERKFLNEAKTVLITPDMIDFTLANAGVEINNPKSPLDLGGLRKNRTGDVNYDLWLDETRLPILTREMLPMEHGLVIFGKPIMYPDYDADIVEAHGPEGLSYFPLRAIGWSEVDGVTTGDGGGTDGLVIYLYTQDPEVDEYMGHAPMQMVDWSGWAYDTEYICNDWHWPDDSDRRSHFNLDPHNIRPHVGMVRMILSSVFGLMTSYIDPWKPDRPSRRWMKRLKMPEDGDVSVIHLRKFLPKHTIKRMEATDYDEDGNVRWSHRWIVRGHWRKQPDKDGWHWTYIDPYIKGPEYLPLVIKNKVYLIER